MSDEPDDPGMAAFETLGVWLTQDGWFPQMLDGRLVYRMGYQGTHGQLTCYAEIVPDLQLFLFYAYAPVKVPEDRRPATAEFVTRANYGLRIGNFEQDMNDGEVRYKCSVDFEGVGLVPDQIKTSTYPAVRTLDRYLPGLMAVAFGGREPAAAIAEIEGPTN